jgi:Divergent InlB B-repeat domain
MEHPSRGRGVPLRVSGLSTLAGTEEGRDRAWAEIGSGVGALTTACRARRERKKGRSATISAARQAAAGRTRSPAALKRLACLVGIALASISVPSSAPAATAPTRALDVAVAGSGVVRSTDGRINCGPRCRARYRPGSVATLTARPRRYFSFAEWNKGCIGRATTCTVAFDSAKSVRARFTRDIGRVRVTVGGRGAVVSQPSGISCATAAYPTGRCAAMPGQGTTMTLTAAAAPGAAFAAWAGACRHERSATCDLVAGASDEVTATFRAVVPAAGEHVLTVQSSFEAVASAPPGIACPQVCSALFASGTAVKLTSLDGMTSWGGACVGDSPACVVSVDEPTNVVATHTPIFMAPLSSFGITVTVAGPGRIVAGTQISCSRLGTKRSCESFFRPRSKVVLRAIPNRNGRFARWDRRVCVKPRARTCTVRVLASRTISAAFVRR